MKTIAGIKPATGLSADEELLANRKKWEAKYDHWLKKQNELAATLQAIGRQTNSSERYLKLAGNTKHYWQLLRDSLPEYRRIITQKKAK